ncbi:hypothetical protein D7Y09_08540 [bacterium 1XD42-1]|nr:hypothetical protein D7X25_10780 [bacterium 1XD42-8]RKJ64604.1 hypothetical protein D7Y09_08540 [bacterium 1XD42-1]
MEKKWKNLVRSIAFVIICCFVFFYIQELLRAKWGEGMSGAHETINAQGFYDLPNNSMDVLCVGSSQIFYNLSPLVMWEKYGFTSYIRGSANQTPLLSYYTIKDMLMTQNPQVIVFEVGRMVNSFDLSEDEWLTRRGLDYMKLSPIKLEAVSALNEGKFPISYIFPFLRYHTRWKELSKTDFEYFSWDHHNWTKGQYMGISILDFEWPENYMQKNDKFFELPEENIYYLEKIIELCENGEIELLLFKAPSGAWNYTMHNSICQLADKYQITFVDYCLPEYIAETKIDDKTDFHYNQYHLRTTGAEKVSIYFGKYLKELFDLPNHKESPLTSTYVDWNTDIQSYHEFKAQNGLE